MTTKAALPLWARTELAGQILTPPDAKVQEGWDYLEKPAFEYLNWMANNAGKYLRALQGGYFDLVVGSAAQVTSGVAQRVITELADGIVPAGTKILLLEGTHTLTASITLANADVVIEGESPLAILAVAGFTLTLSGARAQGKLRVTKTTGGVTLSGANSRWEAIATSMSLFTVSNGAYVESSESSGMGIYGAHMIYLGGTTIPAGAPAKLLILESGAVLGTAATGFTMLGHAATDILDVMVGATATGKVRVNNTTTSTSTVTGAIVNAGGMGMAGPLWVGGNVTIYNTQPYLELWDTDAGADLKRIIIGNAAGVFSLQAQVDVGGGGGDYLTITRAANQLTAFNLNGAGSPKFSVLFSSGNTDIKGTLVVGAETTIQKAAANALLFVQSFSVTAGESPYLLLYKSHNAALNGMTATIDGEALGVVKSYGVNSSSAWTSVGQIGFTQRGAAGVTYLAGDISFMTGTAAAAPATAALITTEKNLVISNGVLTAGNLAYGLIIAGSTDASANPTDAFALWAKDAAGAGTRWPYVRSEGGNVGYIPASSEPLLCKVVEIGDWNMDTTTQVSIAHGLTLSKIRSVHVSIRRDDDVVHIDSLYAASVVAFAANTPDLFHQTDETNVLINRVASGVFDAATYDSTGFNRGWILIWYIP